MATRGIVIVGTGGSARETLVLLRDIERHEPGTWAFRGFAAVDGPDLGLLDRINAPFIGSPTDLVDRLPQAHDWCFIVGIGNPKHRRAMGAALIDQGLEPATLIHPSALVGGDVVIGAGTVICGQSVLTTNIRLGRAAQVNIGCVIGHDARIGDFLTLAQSVNIAGNVTIGDDVTLHTQAVVDRGRTIGSGSVIGSGAVVTRDIEPGARAVGVPARPLP